MIIRPRIYNFPYMLGKVLLSVFHDKGNTNKSLFFPIGKGVTLNFFGLLFPKKQFWAAFWGGSGGWVLKSGFSREQLGNINLIYGRKII